MSDATDATETADTPAAVETTPAPPAAADATTTARPNRRKIREGLVTSASMDKTVVVAVIERVRHRRYAKTVQRTRKLHAHAPENDVRVGDRVRVQETRPLSKLKRWRVVEILERAR